MSNQVDHRKSNNKRNTRRDERPVLASCCCGEGRNGQIGRSKWKALSRRSERRALKEGRVPKIKKYPKRNFAVKPHQTMNDGEISTRTLVRKLRTPRPKIHDTGE
jgi:hypothetical protein